MQYLAYLIWIISFTAGLYIGQRKGIMREALVLCALLGVWGLIIVIFDRRQDTPETARQQ